MNVTFTVEDRDGKIEGIEAPTDMGLSLMEVLKGSGYPILATCGGMALCATCHVSVDQPDCLEPARDMELDMLDTLPNATSSSRLSCQIRIQQDLQNLHFRIMESGEE